MRVNYSATHELDESWLADGWDALLLRWLHDAVAASVAEPNAMTLATLDEHGCPATRMVLCKGIGADGIVFYTNYASEKAKQLAAHPFASATFWWPAIMRQVGLRGAVAAVDAATTAEYWRSRPRGSRLGAWASQQSQPIADRAELQAAMDRTVSRFAEVDDIPVPPQWGGYRLTPRLVEFWQGRENRLHNRIRLHVDTGEVQRLQP